MSSIWIVISNVPASLMGIERGKSGEIIAAVFATIEPDSSSTVTFAKSEDRLSTNTECSSWLHTTGIRAGARG